MCYMMRRFINLCQSFSTLKSSKTTTSPSPIPQTTQKNTFHTSKMADFSSIKHKNLKVNGINMHIAEKGEETAPIILFIHGFPELWYTWRHQIMGLSSLGYRAIAPDMRGYGETDAPTDSRSYSYGHIVGDLVGLIDELGVEKVFVVGHDWGAIVAWWLCLFRPDRVKALVNTSVPFSPRNPKYKPLDMLQATYGENYYISRFQEVGEIEKEISEAGGADVLLRKIFAYKSIAPFMLPKGQPLNKDLPPYPDWLSEQDAAYYSHKYTQTGFTGGLNYYRALNLNWEITAPWTGAQVKVPVKFIVGDLDLTYGSPMVKNYIHKGGMKKDVPLLNDVVILDGVGHFLQEEVPQLITNHIYDFFQKF